MRQSLPVVLLIAGACAWGDDFERQMESVVAELIAANGKGTNAALKRQLLAMAKRDQAVRTEAYFSDKASAARVREQERVDEQLTAELKEIVRVRGWPTIRLAGLRASEAASLVLTHSRDHEFQKQWLPELLRLAERKAILGSSVGMIVDKILVAEDKPQRYGTQFTWADGVGHMLPVEDEAGLDERRAKILLPPMADYRKMLEEMYHVRLE